jgi:hypothetical protein
MNTARASSFPVSWLPADGAVVAELLAVIGVLVWTVGLVWLIVGDVLHAHSRKHHGDSSHHSRLHPR